MSTKTELTFRLQDNEDELVRLDQVTRNDVTNMFDQIREYIGRGFSEIEIYDGEIRSNIQLSFEDGLYRMLHGIFPDTGEDEVFQYITDFNKRFNNSYGPKMSTRYSPFSPRHLREREGAATRRKGEGSTVRPWRHLFESLFSPVSVIFQGEKVGSSSLFTDSRIAEEKFYELLENRSLDLKNFV